MRKKSGKEILVHTSLSPIIDSENNITGVISYTLDITEQKKNEERLKQQARIINNIHDASLLQIWAVRLRHGIKAQNFNWNIRPKKLSVSRSIFFTQKPKKS